jgi:hypothetical protein
MAIWVLQSVKNNPGTLVLKLILADIKICEIIPVIVLFSLEKRSNCVSGSYASKSVVTYVKRVQEFII